MRWRLLAATFAVLWFAGVPEAKAGIGCTDMCTQDPAGNTCADLVPPLGCNPFSMQCEPCMNDDWCQPNGTCQPDGSCAGVICDADAGVTDAGPPDTGPVDAGPDAGPRDVGPRDAGDAAAPDSGPTVGDAGEPDMGMIDSGATPSRGGIPSETDKGMFEEECTCTSAAPVDDAPPFGGLALLLLGLAARRRR